MGEHNGRLKEFIIDVVHIVDFENLKPCKIVQILYRIDGSEFALSFSGFLVEVRPLLINYVFLIGERPLAKWRTPGTRRGARALIR